MKYVALLRGINVGGNRPIRMADLRATFEAAGACNVVTYIQSGNVVFDHPSRSASALTFQLGNAIANAEGFSVELVVRTARELADVVEASPFPGAPPKSLHVTFLPRRVTAAQLESVEAAAFVPERYAIYARELYLCLPNGIGNSKLAATLLRHKALAGGTARNWRTVLALAELTTKR